MSRFSSGALTTGVTANTARLEIINTSTVKEAFIKAVTVVTNTAAVAVVAFGRPAAAGITPTSPVALQDEMGLATGLVKTALAWGTGPTVPAVFYRRYGIPATIGQGVLWTFLGKGFRLAPLATAVLWCLSDTSNIFQVTVEAEQDTNTVANP